MPLLSDHVLEDTIAAVIQPVLLLHTSTELENIPLQHSEGHIPIPGVTPENPFEERESTDPLDLEYQLPTSIEKSERPYNYYESRLSLFHTGFSRFFVTFLFCALIFLALKGYKGFHTTKVLSNHAVRTFNSITLALSFRLGLNTTSSLIKICCNPRVVTIDSTIYNSTHVRFDRRMRNSRWDIRTDGPLHARNACSTITPFLVLT
jgi:hypothetical protein